MNRLHSPRRSHRGALIVFWLLLAGLAVTNLVAVNQGWYCPCSTIAAEVAR